MVWESQVVICISYSIPWLGKLRAAAAEIWAPHPWVCSSGKDGCLCPKWCLRLRSWAPALSCFSLQAFTWNFSSEMQKHKFMLDFAHFTGEKQGHSILRGLLLQSKAPVLWSGPNSILHCCKSEGFVQILHRDDNCPAEWAPGSLVNLGVCVWQSASLFTYWHVRNSTRGEASNCTGFFQGCCHRLGDQLRSIECSRSSWCLWSVLMWNYKRQKLFYSY